MVDAAPVGWKRTFTAGRLVRRRRTLSTSRRTEHLLSRELGEIRC
jgi:hypothetical protein